MLKINTSLNVTDNGCLEDSIDNTVIIESDSTSTTVDNMIQKDDNDDICSTTTIRESENNLDVSINVIITNNTKKVICNELCLENLSPYLVKWSLINSEGTELYSSDICLPGNIYRLDLSNTKIKAKTKFKLKALVNNKENISCNVLEFSPTTNKTANYILKGNNFLTEIYYIGTSCN